MAPLHLVVWADFVGRVDAALPQAGGLAKKPCQSGDLSAIVQVGRTQAVCTSRRGSACCGTLQEHRSRGCRAPKLSCRSAWLPSWQLALASRKKSSTWKIRQCRSSRPTPASTSKTNGRANGANAPRPALFLSAARLADNPARFIERFACRPRRDYAARTATFSLWRFSCGLLQSSPCWRLPPSPPAPNPRPSPSRFPSRLNPPRPANTVPDFPERARREARPAPVLPPPRAPEQKVRPC